jgi:hypothetical protein
MGERLLESLRAIAEKTLKSSAVRAADGTLLYTPDGYGHYDALWTRDFAYMAEYAGDLLDTQDLYAGAEYLIRHARPADGWIPDRVHADGETLYAAGSLEHPCGEPNLDDGPFLVIAVDCLLRRLSEQEAGDFLARWKEALLRGLNCIPTNAAGLVYNPPEKPHSPYGFTDCIGKTGTLMLESVLMWRAYKMLAHWLPQEREELNQRAAMIEQALPAVFADESGMLLAATEDCRQIDVWGSCYALAVGFPLEEDARRAIARWLVEHYDGIVQDGQVRHTAPGEYWARLLEDVAPGEYQNGAYWATATGWLALALREEAPRLARRTLQDAERFFVEQGVYECVNGSYRKLDRFVVSATNVYGAAKLILDGDE